MLLPQVVLCGVMLAGAFLTCFLAKVDFSQLFVPYLIASIAVTIVCVLISVFWWVLQLALKQADNPVATVIARLKEQAPLLILPALVFPVFLSAFTATKTAIPFLVGYHWDLFWADADKALFGADAWRIAHRILGSSNMPVWEWFYTVGWGFALVFTSALVALNADRRRVGIFYSAMMATWIIGGGIFAYAFSAAGPVFVSLGDPALAGRFAELNALMNQHLSMGGAVRQTQEYLASAVQSHVAVKGGGVSAMPSMHLGAAMIYILASRRSLWLLLSVPFWAVIFLCSAYFGYHYWIDDLIASAIACLCWAAAARFYREETITRHILNGEPAGSETGLSHAGT